MALFHTPLTQHSIFILGSSGNDVLGVSFEEGPWSTATPSTEAQMRDLETNFRMAKYELSAWYW